ncbi:MAG: disulfide bond formation protein B [Candidatus Pacebacteria bacterium]|nr:disulfide bond formation protein B [Candidatus Paceibacterota bacterium]
MNLASSVNTILSILTILGQIFAVYIFIVLILGKRSHKILGKPFLLLERHGILFGFLVALISMLGSLTYSDILGYEPCKLCWFQRIFMYPQVFLLGLALFRKERFIVPYALLLAVIGEIVALYHYIVQLGFFPAPCSVSGYSITCSKVFTLQYGYITIPLMAFTAFILIIFGMLFSKKE